MKSFKEMLAVGGKSNSLGMAGEIVKLVLNDHAKLNELFNCIYADDAWVRMRAIDSFEKVARVHPEWIQPYLDTILEELTLNSQPSIQWHLAQIFAIVALTDKQQKDALTWLKSRLTTTDVDWIVSINTMKTLLQFNASGHIDSDELLSLIKIQESHKSKSVRRKAAEFSEMLTQN